MMVFVVLFFVGVFQDLALFEDLVDDRLARSEWLQLFTQEPTRTLYAIEPNCLMAILLLFTLRVFARNLLKDNRRRNTFRILF